MATVTVSYQALAKAIRATVQTATVQADDSSQALLAAATEQLIPASDARFRYEGCFDFADRARPVRSSTACSPRPWPRPAPRLT